MMYAMSAVGRVIVIVENEPSGGAGTCNSWRRFPPESKARMIPGSDESSGMRSIETDDAPPVKSARSHTELEFQNVSVPCAKTRVPVENNELVCDVIVAVSPDALSVMPGTTLV